MTRLMFTLYHDENTSLKEYSTCKEKADVDMEKGILFNLYQNLAVYFLKGKYFREAKMALKDMEAIGVKNSQLCFRKAQIICADAESTIEELREAVQCLQDGIELKKTEEIFKHNERFLSMFNLDNHNTIFHELLDFAEKRVIEEENKLFQRVEQIMNRAKEIKQAEQQILARGLTPEESPDFYETFCGGIENYDQRILSGLEHNYFRAICFFEESKDPKQVKISMKGFQTVRELIHNFASFNDLSLGDSSVKGVVEIINRKLGLDVEGEDFQRRFEKLKKQFARDFLEQPKVDFQIFSHVIKQIMKEEKKKKQANEEEVEG